MMTDGCGFGSGGACKGLREIQADGGHGAAISSRKAARSVLLGACLLAMAHAVPALRAVQPVNSFAPAVIQHVLTWGVNGSGNGEFVNPTAIAVDALGNVYVADTDNHRIQRFDSEGRYQNQWGSFGTGNGEFNAPCGLAFDPSGNIYVVDKNNYRIQKFTTNGVYLSQWGTFGSADGQFNSPHGVAIGVSSGVSTVFVADTSNHRVQAFTTNGTFVRKWGTAGSADGSFNTPEELAVDAASQVYVADSGNHRIQKFSATGAFVTKWGTQGSATARFNTPLGLDVGGRVLVADSGNDRVEAFSLTGVYGLQWGGSGAGNGQFDTPTDIALGPSNEVYVVDGNLHRVQKFFFHFGAREDTPTPLTGLGVEDPDGAGLDTVTLSVINGTITVVPGGASVSGGANGSSTLTLSGTPMQLNLALATATYLGLTNYHGAELLTISSHDAVDATSTVTQVPFPVAPVNDPPTLDPLLDLVVLVGSGVHTVNLSGITDGGDGGQVLNVNALSGNNPVIPHPSVNYTSPNATGTLQFTAPASGVGVVGIAVTVMDNGGTANGGVDFVTRTFNVTLNNLPANSLPGFTVMEDACGPLTGLVVGDLDGNLTTVSLAVTNGTLIISNLSGAMIIGGANGTGAIILSGNQAQLTAALATLVYCGAPDFDGVDTITVVSTDSFGAMDTDSATITVTPTQDTPVVTWPTPANIVYGTPLGPAQLNASASVPGTFAYNPAAGTILGAGPNQVLTTIFTPADLSRYSRVTTMVQITVVPAPLTVRADDKSRSVGTANPALTATFTGFVNGEGPGVLSGAPELSTTATIASPGGTYPITIGPGTLSSLNYAFMFQDGTLTIAELPPVNRVPGQQIVNSSGQLRLSASNAPPNGLSVSDTAGTTLTVVLRVIQGRLSLPSNTGLTLLSGTNWLQQSELRFSGPIAAVNTALDSLIYHGPAQFAVGDTLTIMSTDGTGLTDTDSVPIGINLVALGGIPTFSLDSLSTTGRMVTNIVVTPGSLETNVIRSVTFNRTNTSLILLPVGRQDGSTNRTQLMLLVQYSDGTSESITIPAIIYQPLLTSVTGGIYQATFTDPLFNPQNSLFEQRVRIVNNTPFDFTAVRITATNLPANVFLWNAAGTNTLGAYVHFGVPLAAGAERTFTLQYFSRDRQPFRPGVQLDLLTQAPATTFPTNGTPINITIRRGYSPDGHPIFYLEFLTRLGRTYYVRYRDSIAPGTPFKVSPTTVVGTGRVMHWLDEGPPNTESPPSSVFGAMAPFRFYEVIAE